MCCKCTCTQETSCLLELEHYSRLSEKKIQTEFYDDSGLLLKTVAWKFLLDIYTTLIVGFCATQSLLSHQVVSLEWPFYSVLEIRHGNILAGI